MKKIIIPVLILILTGCNFNISNIDNTPTKKVENYLANYQKASKEVMDDLDLVIEKEDAFTDSQKEKYRKIMKKNFKNLTYTIKEETVNGEQATVEVEINVTDLYKAISASDAYLEENKKDFTDSNGNLMEEKFIDYKLEKMDKMSDKVKYTLYFNVSKNNDEWMVDDISETDEEKILGIYEY